MHPSIWPVLDALRNIVSRLLSNVMPGFGREAVASNRLFFIWWKVLFIALLIVIIVSISSVFMWGDLFVYST